MKQQPKEENTLKRLDQIQHVPPELILDYEIRASWWAPYCEKPWLAWIASTWFSLKLKRKYHRYIVHLDEQVKAQKAFHDKLQEQKDKADAGGLQPGEAQ